MKKPISYRKQRLPELLQHLAAEFLERESNHTSLITVTRAELSQDSKRVQIFFTVLPDDKEEQALEFANRRKKDFAEFVDKHGRVGRMPEIKFSIDIGEKNRQRIDELSSES
jgi:ribosome-binding factor A